MIDAGFSTKDVRNISSQIADMRSDFRMSQDSRFMSRLTGVNPAGSGADYHYRFESAYIHMIERARHYERDDAVVGQGIKRLTANVIQEGFTPDPDTGSRDLDGRLKDLWASWSEDPEQCHSEGEFTFHDMEELAFSSAIRDGDIFAFPLVEGSVQLIEGHRPRTPINTRRNVVHGILLDDRARRQELWVSKEDIGMYSSIRRVSDVARYSFRDDNGTKQIFQLYFPKRTSQRRGYTALAPVSDVIGMHDDLEFTKLVQHQMASLIVIIRQHMDGSRAGTGNRDGLSAGLGGTAMEAGIRRIPGLKAGMDIKPNPGEKIEFNSSNIPNESFFSHANLLLTFIAINLDMPVAMLLLDASNTNFSGWRGSMDQARVRFRWFQRKMISHWHRPIYKWKVRQWLIDDPAAADFASKSDQINPFKHGWQIPGWPYIEPFKDAQADALQQEKFLSSPSDIQALRGKQWDQIAPRIVQDKGLLIEHAIVEADRINKLHPGAVVGWREILGPGLTSSIQLTSDSVNNDQDKGDLRPAS